MSIFELPKGARDLGSILNEYRPKKRRGNHLETDRAYDDFANPFDEESIGYPVEGNEIERSDANSYHHEPSSPPMNSSTVNLRGRNDEPGHSRLDEIAEALRTLTYGEMLELAESMWKVNSQGQRLPSQIYQVYYTAGLHRAVSKTDVHICSDSKIGSGS